MDYSCISLGPDPQFTPKDFLCIITSIIKITNLGVYLGQVQELRPVGNVSMAQYKAIIINPFILKLIIYCLAENKKSILNISQ